MPSPHLIILTIISSLLCTSSPNLKMQRALALSAIVPAALAQTFYGCYQDIPAHALSGAVTTDYTTMTVAQCETYCTGSGFSLWGLQYGGEW